jgi:8-oxo-dGTP pyrophosphatase MutT (NUDIX family)
LSGPAPRDPFTQTGWPGLRARLFHLLFLLRRPMTLGVRGLVLDREAGTVFLLRHTYVPGWQMPGGGVERGETAREALERELMEEGNIRLTGEPELRSFHFNPLGGGRDHIAVYLVTAFEQERPKKPDREIAESGFFPIGRLPEGVTPGTRRRVEEIIGNQTISDRW